MRPPRTASRLLQRSGGLSAFVCRRCRSRGFASAAAATPGFWLRRSRVPAARVRWLAGTGNIGLALCRLDVMTDLPPPPGEAPKYDPESRFIMSASLPDRFAQLPSQTFNVKAFVPDWLRRGLAEQAGAARGH
ncbi:transferase CAF17 [Magnaporthiopsis poae ATCC 64411]|uniref:Transferase CAF17 n=1 Tax=Magnaporthiopsis poae (strain ATCC 64411 / 73-15) TaxID=644358 RepID=A0A0C4DKS0_MAGP6|nr:transferase CAF17 [Magnaporthiopsis poae ATCC 64411]